MAMEDSVATCDNMLDEMPPPEGKTSWSSINWVLELCVVYDWKVVSGHGKAFKWKCRCCGRSFSKSFYGTSRIDEGNKIPTPPRHTEKQQTEPTPVRVANEALALAVEAAKHMVATQASDTY